MAYAAVKYGIALRAGEATRRLRASAPVDHVLALTGLDLERDAGRVVEIYATYAPFRLLGDAGARHEVGAKYEAGQLADQIARFRRQIIEWQQAGIPDAFLRAAKEAAEGRLSPELAPYLERVGSPDEDLDEITDLLSLAAWSIDRNLQRLHRYEVVDCELCGTPFLSTGARYCRRIAPGSFTHTCLEVAHDLERGLPRAADVRLTKPVTGSRRAEDFAHAVGRLFDRARRRVQARARPS